MATIQSALRWLMTSDGVVAAAAIIFGLLWLTKNIPAVARWLADDRRKAVANLILSLAPAAAALLDNAATPREAWLNALKIVLGAAGIQGVLTGLLGERLSQRLKLRSGDGA